MFSQMRLQEEASGDAEVPDEVTRALLESTWGLGDG